jgi:hypothetical protein
MRTTKQDIMLPETDQPLSEAQWEALRALRPGGTPVGRVNRYALEQRATLDLVNMSGEHPALTTRGRAVVLRGCPRLWDLAA